MGNPIVPKPIKATSVATFGATPFCSALIRFQPRCCLEMSPEQLLFKRKSRNQLNTRRSDNYLLFKLDAILTVDLTNIAFYAQNHIGGQYPFSPISVETIKVRDEWRLAMHTTPMHNRRIPPRAVLFRNFPSSLGNLTEAQARSNDGNIVLHLVVCHLIQAFLRR